MDVGIKNIPKRQFIGAFFVLLFLAAGFLFVDGFSGKESVLSGDDSSNPDALSFATEAEKDSDNDGLKDWEEGLWKTDITIPDTDGDGAPDGEEVRNKRNPLKAGPDDEYKNIEESPLGTVVKESEAERNLTLTDIFARDFLAGYFTLKNAGQYNEATRDKFIKTLFAGIDTASPKEYTLKDLTTTQKSDAETLRRYGNALGEVAFKYRHLSEGKELFIVDSAVKKEDREKLAELAPIIADYDAFVEEYRAVTVPLAAYEVHLALLNLNAEVRDSLVRMSRLFDDPMEGTAGLSAYRNAAEDGGVVIRDLKNFFSKNGVIFNNDEPGRIFKK